MCLMCVYNVCVCVRERETVQWALCGYGCLCAGNGMDIMYGCLGLCVCVCVRGTEQADGCGNAACSRHIDPSIPLHVVFDISL